MKSVPTVPFRKFHPNDRTIKKIHEKNKKNFFETLVYVTQLPLFTKWGLGNMHLFS